MELIKSVVILLLFVPNEITVNADQPNNGNNDIPIISTTSSSEVSSTNLSIQSNGTENKSLQNLPNKNNTATSDVNTSEVKEQQTSTNSTSEDMHSNASDLLYVEESKIDTEVSEMLDIPKPLKVDVSPEHLDVDKDNGPVDTQIMLLDHFYNINTEGKKFEESNNRKIDPLETSGLVAGKMAGLLAGVFLAVSIVGYVVLLSWRKYLENRYGNREMLVDNDFCQQMNDLEHFSI